MGIPRSYFSSTAKQLQQKGTFSERQRKLNELRDKSEYKDERSGVTSSFGEERRKESLKLAFLIMTFLYSQDDQKLSRREKNDIKKAIKEEAPEFSSDDLIEVYSHFNRNPNIHYVLDYLKNKNIDDSLFNDSLEVVLDNYRDKDIYVQLLRSLKEAQKNKF